MADNVNHPSHYTAGEVECIDAIKAALGPSLFAGYLWGNAIKYLWRWPRKNMGEDLAKLEFYVRRLQEEGYAEPDEVDESAGLIRPNALLAALECGDSVKIPRH